MALFSANCNVVVEGEIERRRGREARIGGRGGEPEVVRDGDGTVGAGGLDVTRVDDLAVAADLTNGGSGVEEEGRSEPASKKRGERGR